MDDYPKLKLVAIGGGAITLLNDFHGKYEQEIDIIAIDSDLSELQKSKSQTRVHIGQNLPVLNPEMARESVIQAKTQIMNYLQDAYFVILVAELGSNTGSGAAPEIAQWLSDNNITGLSVLCLPFEKEDPVRIKNATESLDKIKLTGISVYTYPSELNTSKNKTLKQYLAKSNEANKNVIKGLLELVYCPGLLNLDVADLKVTFYKNTSFDYTWVEEDLEKSDANKEEMLKRIEKMVRKMTYNLKKQKVNSKSWTEVLIAIYASESIGIFELGQLSSHIKKKLSKEAEAIVGVSLIPEMNSKLGVHVYGVKERMR